MFSLPIERQLLIQPKIQLQSSQNIWSKTDICPGTVCEDFLYYVKIVKNLLHKGCPILAIIGTVGNFLTIAVLTQRSLPTHHFMLITLAGKKDLISMFMQ